MRHNSVQVDNPVTTVDRLHTCLVLTWFVSQDGMADFFSSSSTMKVEIPVLLERLDEQLDGCTALELSTVLTCMENDSIILIDGADIYLI